MKKLICVRYERISIWCDKIEEPKKNLYELYVNNSTISLIYGTLTKISDTEKYIMYDFKSEVI